MEGLARQYANRLLPTAWLSSVWRMFFFFSSRRRHTRFDCDWSSDVCSSDLVRRGALPAERVVGVETGGCPHTAIREDASVNLEAAHALMRAFPDLELLLIESGGDNLAATFSPELVDATIYVIDVAEGDKIPRKGGPGITRSDLLVINKIDLAPHVGADLAVMERDARRMRGERPFVFTNLRTGEGVPALLAWIREELLLEPRRAR